MGDGYIQRIALCKNVTAVREVNHTMYEDFIRRVHRLREDPKLSPQIQHCADYVELHLEEDLSLPELAQAAGYTEAYLSRIPLNDSAQRTPSNSHKKSHARSIRAWLSCRCVYIIRRSRRRSRRRWGGLRR